MSWSRAEVSAFLAEEPRLGRLATTSAAGQPHVVPVWFAQEDDTLLVHSMAESRKVDNVRENGRFSMTVDVSTPPYKGVTLWGSAEVDDSESRDWAGLIRELAVRYLGSEHGPGYGEYIAGIPGDHLVLVLRAEDWSAWDFSQG